MTPRYDRALVWLRRDLRAEDHAALHHALREARAVRCVFVFDTDILHALPSRADRRVEFIWHAVAQLRTALEALGGGLAVLHGCARELVPAHAAAIGADAVYCAHDYEPQAVERDAAVERALHHSGRRLHSFRDQAVFEKSELLTQAGKPFTVFTPYKNAWLKALDPGRLAPLPVATHAAAFEPEPAAPLPSLQAMGFGETNLTSLALPLGASGARQLLEDFRGRMDGYRERRDYPAVRGPSYLSVHLRFGTIGVRELAREAHARRGEGAAAWLSELIWRDFYFQILWHHPHVVEGAFRREFDALRFPDHPDRFAAWCEGRTGYPLVDAAVRQLNQTGYMHNRLRMVAASFLVKDLHVHWRQGERYFADHLNDFDLSANNGGWQWAASTGCDAQPWFRIFNPVTQSEKFDADGRFIRLYVPELATLPAKFVHAPWMLPPLEQQALGVVIGRDYPAPVVDHATARAETLRLFGAIREG
ncbi:MAG: cryptochrome/photolyase family protein [Betaproteobacteria bacterium]|jgi:deoxyribodipyrimidine photo-lyase|nr:deoxyribodipyrimidine photo-lyase [Rhodocyclaceae bacterium]MCA3132904.1 deoxyribodipyrimidine photo-lyase [Rhodocyclaceae bacterium]MCA3143442.1 deoxyribodipyrimidine photo-lyase [Rhodocyclaceae bacterium]MCA3147280.1 deoxyribodipyrimidine photo-lyase [Rhodocyclaceae bacterium]MCE2896765.1 DNA photolyase family protein [Betaproteobacteria bacterium]